MRRRTKAFCTDYDVLQVATQETKIISFLLGWESLLNMRYLSVIQTIGVIMMVKFNWIEIK